MQENEKNVAAENGATEGQVQAAETTAEGVANTEKVQEGQEGAALNASVEGSEPAES